MGICQQSLFVLDISSEEESLFTWEHFAIVVKQYTLHFQFSMWYYFSAAFKITFHIPF